MGKTLQSLPEGVKESILEYSLTGGTYKEILQRIVSLRTVTKEWNELLRKHRVVYTSLLHATVDDEPEAAELIKTPIASYLANLVTQSNLTPEKKQLLIQLCRSCRPYYEVLECLSYLDETQFTKDECLVGWPLIIYFIITLPEEKMDAFVHIKDRILSKMISSSLTQEELVDMLTRGKQYDTKNRYDRFNLNKLLKMDNARKTQMQGTLNYSGLLEMLGLLQTNDLSVMNARVRDYKGLSASCFLEKVQAAFDLTHMERAFLADVFEGNSKAIKQNYLTPKNPVLIDIALIIALKAEHDHCVHALIAKELTGSRDSREMQGVLLVLIQAATRSESVCSTLGNYYAHTIELIENPMLPIILSSSIVHSSLLEEVQCVNAFLRNLFKNSTLGKHIPFDLFIACVNQDEEEIAALVRQLVAGLTFNNQFIIGGVIGAALQASIFNQRYKAVMALCTHEIGASILESEPFRRLCSADHVLNEMVATISASSIFRKVINFCEQSRIGDLLKPEVVMNFLNQTGVADIDRVVQAACTGELETLPFEPEPYFWDLALLYALATNETAAIGPLLNKRTVFAADDESNDATLQKELILWQIRLAFDRKEKGCATTLLSQCPFTVNSFKYESMSDLIIMNETTCEGFVFACTELYSNKELPSFELADWLTACWSEEEGLISMRFPHTLHRRFYYLLAQWACKTGRMSLITSLFDNIDSSPAIVSFFKLELRDMLEMAVKYDQYDVIEFLRSKLKQ